MRSKYMISVLINLMLIVPVVNAAYDYSFSVGTHQVSFNTSTPIWEITKPLPSATDYGYEETYSPTYSWGAYASSNTIITSRNNSDHMLTEGPSLKVEVRDFDVSIPRNAMNLEIETVDDFLSYLPLLKCTPGRCEYYCIGKEAIAIDNGEESFGVLINWPSDQTEIVITGILPNKEMWEEISSSLELVR